MLGAATRDAWSGVSSCLPDGAYLAGGSALALRMGHRRSYDLDVFSRAELDCDRLVAELTARFAGTVGIAADIVSATRVAVALPGTRLDYTYDPSHLISSTDSAAGIPVAGLADITAMKVAAVADRAALRDWFDLMVIQQRTGMSHRECFLLYRDRYAETHGAATVALTADRLCKWYPGMAGLAPDPHLSDVDGNPVGAATREYWMSRQSELDRQLSEFKRRAARTQPPGTRQQILGRRDLDE